MSRTSGNKGKELVIRTALESYPGELLPVDFEKMSLKQLVAAAKKNQFGDTLASFVVHELNEGLDGGDWDRAAELIERARDDLDAVMAGLFAARAITRSRKGAGARRTRRARTP